MPKEAGTERLIATADNYEAKDKHIEELTYEELLALMEHDSHRRIKGKIRQQRWSK